MSATAYLRAGVPGTEAGDSGIRSLVNHRSLACTPSTPSVRGAEAGWLPRLAAGDALGCFGLTEPDFGSNPVGCSPTPSGTATTVLNGTKMWITNGNVADVAVVWAQTDDGIRGFVVPMDAGVTANLIPPTRCRCARPSPRNSSCTGRAPAGDALLGGPGVAGPAVVPERSAVPNRVPAPSAPAATAWRPPSLRHRPRSVRPTHRGVPADAEEARRHGRRNWATVMLLALHLGRSRMPITSARTGEHRQTQQRPHALEIARRRVRSSAPTAWRWEHR